MSSVSGIPEITRDASVGNVALVTVSITIVVLIMIAAAMLFIRRREWHLDGTYQNTFHFVLVKIFCHLSGWFIDPSNASEVSSGFCMALL